jgi:hypothetical protein
MQSKFAMLRALSQGEALPPRPLAMPAPPTRGIAFDASMMHPIQDEDEYNPLEVQPARQPSFLYVLDAPGGTARQAAEWWLSDAPHHFGDAPHTHYAWLEGYALALDNGKVYAEALRNVQDAAWELGRALSPEDARRYALRRALDLRLVEIRRAGKGEWRRKELFATAMDAAINEARAADEARYAELLRDVHATRPSGLREYYRDAQTAPRRASSKREAELREHFMGELDPQSAPKRALVSRFLDTGSLPPASGTVRSGISGRLRSMSLEELQRMKPSTWDEYASEERARIERLKASERAREDTATRAKYTSEEREESKRIAFLRQRALAREDQRRMEPATWAKHTIEERALIERRVAERARREKMGTSHALCNPNDYFRR